jgi:hypothetical protein
MLGFAGKRSLVRLSTEMSAAGNVVLAPLESAKHHDSPPVSHDRHNLRNLGRMERLTGEFFNCCRTFSDGTAASVVTT